jgi:hypothetical protein
LNDVVKYKILLAMEKEGKNEYTYYECDPPKSFNIKKLLDGIEEISDSQRLREVHDMMKKADRQIDRIEDKLDSYFNELVSLVNINTDKIIEAVEELNEGQAKEISGEIEKIFDEHAEEMAVKLKEIYLNIKQTKDAEMKLKLSVPFIKMLGVDIGTEVNLNSMANKLKNKAKEINEKYNLELKFSKLMVLL